MIKVSFNIDKSKLPKVDSEALAAQASKNLMDEFRNSPKIIASSNEFEELLNHYNAVVKPHNDELEAELESEMDANSVSYSFNVWHRTKDE